MKKWRVVRFDQHIDPAASIRVGWAASGMLSAGEMIAYLGEGVFVPLDGEQPIGRVRVGPSLDALEEPTILGDRIAGKYKLLQPLGEGGMGVVWVAHNLGLDVHVALKFIRPEADFPGASERLIRMTQGRYSLVHTDAGRGGGRARSGSACRNP